MGFESRAISVQVTKQIFTIFSKTCDKGQYSTSVYQITLCYETNVCLS